MASAETLALRARSVATNSGINPGAVALALAVPFLFLHIKYQPGVRVPLGSTHLGLELSDLAVVVVALVALREGLKMGFAPLRPALPLWIAVSCAAPLDLHPLGLARARRHRDEVLGVRPARVLRAADPPAAHRLGAGRCC